MSPSWCGKHVRVIGMYICFIRMHVMTLHIASYSSALFCGLIHCMIAFGWSFWVGHLGPGITVYSAISANKSISELRRIYFRLRERVFSGQEPAQRGMELEKFAVEIFSSSKRMSDVIDVDAPKLVDIARKL